MADPVEVKDAPVAEVPPVVTEAPPTAESPPAAPVPQADPAPSAEPPAAQSQPERTPSLLEAAEAPGEVKETPAPAGDKPPEEKKVEEPPKAEPPKEAPAEDKPPEAAKPEAAKPPEAVAYEFNVPEGLQMDDALKGEFTGALDGFRADPKMGAQKLMDMHHAQMQRYAEHLNQEQHRIFGETKKQWRDQVQADEMIGGAGHRTAMSAIAMARNMLVSDHPQGSPGWKKDLADFHNALDATGAGDNPHILKAFYRAARIILEPSAPVVTDSKPVPDAGRRKGADALYDNDRSPNGRQ
jgi:hypothetical protein